MLSSRPISIHEDVPARGMHTKTPGRGLKGRHALQENTVQRGSMTVNVKGKSANTPFRLATQGQKGAREGKAPATVSRPLVDKTPAPNRVYNAALFKTPAPETAKLAKFSLLEQASSITPGAILRPSSTRKSVRARRSSAQQQHFQTPVTQGNHWDVSDGDLSIEGPGVETEQKEEVEDYDEIEYMPPTAIDLPYQPAFEMPDYKVMGKMLFTRMHSSHPDDSAVPFALHIDQMAASGDLLDMAGHGNASHANDLRLPELEDDSIFSARPDPPLTKLNAKPSANTPTSRFAPPRSVPGSRSGSSHQTVAGPSRVPSKTITTAGSRPAIATSAAGRVSRPAATATSASARPQPVAIRSTTATTGQRAANASKLPTTLAKGKTSVYATTTAVTTSRIPSTKTGPSLTTAAVARDAPMPRGTVTSRLRTMSTVGGAKQAPVKVQRKVDDATFSFKIYGEGLDEDFKFDV